MIWQLTSLVFLLCAKGKLLRSSVVEHKNPIERCSYDTLNSIKGYILDLDGTVYDREGILPGVQDFFNWMDSANKTYLLLSNGFKSPNGVVAKLSSQKFYLNQKISPESVHTAGVAVAEYMKKNAPAGSYIFAIGTGIEYGDGSRDSLKLILERHCPQEFATWNFRTDMTLSEIHQWASYARNGKNVFVLLAPMANPSDTFGDDPVTKKSGYNQMDYDLMVKINALLRNKAYLVVGAPDVADKQKASSDYPEIDTSFVTTGGFEELFLRSADMLSGTTKNEKYHVNVGKGGNRGAEYMMDVSMEMMQKKNPGINNKNIAIVGDNFDTDIKAGNDADVLSILVLSGVHKLEHAVDKKSKADCFVDDVAEIIRIMQKHK